MGTVTSEACSGRSRSRGVSRRGIRRLADFLKPAQVLLAELGDLGSDDHPAVSLVGVAPEIFLMVLFRRVERFEGNNLRDNGVAPNPRVVQLGDDFLRDLFLRLIVGEDARAALAAHIRPLTLQARAVVPR